MKIDKSCNNCLILLLMLSCFSCHYLVEQEFPEFENRIVVNGTLVADSIFLIQVTFTANLSDSVPLPINNAIVFIENDGNCSDTLEYKEDGWYESNKTIVAGAEYTCNVEVPGFARVTAQTYVPIPTIIRDLLFTELAGVSDEGEALSSFQFVINNNLQQHQYWEVRMIGVGIYDRFDFQTGEWTNNYTTVSIPIEIIAGQDIVLLHEASPLTLFSDRDMTQQEYKVKCFYDRSTDFELDNMHYIELRSVSESYYNYHKQLYLYNTAQYDDIGVSHQNYPLYSNVMNGLGVFSAYSSSRIKIEINQ